MECYINKYLQWSKNYYFLQLFILLSRINGLDWASLTYLHAKSVIVFILKSLFILQWSEFTKIQLDYGF